MYTLSDISIVIPSYNNLEYLKLAYQSIRDISDDIEVILYGDGCNDGTNEWFLEIKHQNTITHSYSERLGHTILYDYGFQIASRKIIGILHADMIVHKNFFFNILKHIGPNNIISGTNIEPPLHPPGGEKHILNAGLYPNEFNEYIFNEFCNNRDINQTQQSIFAPWFLLKDEYLNKIGGHDIIYAPYGYEDSDIFSRMALAGFEFIQSRDAFVYHFTQRGHKWTKGIGIENNGYRDQMEKTRKTYIRKFGTEPIFDYNHKPTPAPKYNIGFIIKNCNQNMLEIFEPWCSNIYVDCDYVSYIKKEQPNTKYNIPERIKSYYSEKTNQILVEFDATQLNQNNFQLLQQLPQIILESGELGTFELDIFKIDISGMDRLEKHLIKINSPYYQSQLL